MRREVKVLLTKATDSALLSIEHFNRPWDRGRHEVVLILMDRSFELLLKAVIVDKGGKIREPRAKETIGFDVCVRKCLSDIKSKCLFEEEAVTIQIINSLRDAAQHYILDISERQLYIYTQAGLTLFDKILREVFNKRLVDYLPERVLAVSTNPPTDFGNLMEVEFEDIKRLVIPGSHKRLQVRSKLRSFAIIEASLSGNRLQPSERELEKIVAQMSKGKGWQEIFPGIKRLALDTEDKGLSVTLRITKSKGQPIHLVPEGTLGATVVAVKRVDEMGYYSLNLTALASKIGLSSPKLLAVIKELKMQKNPDYFKEFRFGSTNHKRYSPKALDFIKQELPNIDIDKVWNENNPWYRKKANS